MKIIYRGPSPARKIIDGPLAIRGEVVEVRDDIGKELVKLPDWEKASMVKEKKKGGD